MKLVIFDFDGVLVNTTITIHDILRDTFLKLKDNYKLSIISSSWGDIISSFLKKENLTNYFDDILGFDVHTSKVVKIKSLLEKYNVLPKDAVFITDSLGDILESNECDVKSIGVTWGLHDKKTLEKGNPVDIIDDTRELESVINNVLK